MNIKIFLFRLYSAWHSYEISTNTRIHRVTGTAQLEKQQNKLQQYGYEY